MKVEEASRILKELALQRKINLIDIFNSYCEANSYYEDEFEVFDDIEFYFNDALKSRLNNDFYKLFEILEDSQINRNDDYIRDNGESLTSYSHNEAINEIVDYYVDVDFVDYVKNNHLEVWKMVKEYLQLNEKNKLFQNTDFRRALSLSVNRKALASAVGGANKPVTTFSPNSMTEVNGKDYTELVKTAETDKLMTYNPTLAKSYWKKAQKALGQSKVNFTLLTYDDDDAKKAGEYLQSTIESNLKGVNVRVNSLPKKTALVRGQNGNFDALLMGWQADFTDPISFLDLNTSNASYNWGKWANKEYDKYVAASKTTGNENTRFEDLAKAERVLLTEQGVVPLYQPAEAWMVRPTVKGVVYNGAGANYNFKYAYVEK